MVLENIPSDPDPYSTPSSSPSSDPFQSSSSDSTTQSIDFTKIPKPIPFSWLWGYSQKRIERRIIMQAGWVSRFLKRRLRPEEFEAVSYHRGRAEFLSSMGVPLGVAAGQYRVYTTREERRFPFQKFFKNTKWAFNGDVLSYAGRALLRGPQAASMVEGLRSSCYLSIGFWLGSALLKSYGTSVGLVGLMQDKRMEDWNTAMNKGIRERRGLPPEAPSRSGRTSIPDGSQRRDPTGQGRRSAEELWRSHRTAIGARTQDDASPTAGNEDFFGLGSSTGPSDENVMDDSQTPTKGRRQQPPQPRDFASDYVSSTDDSSYRSPSASPYGSGGGESTWERIRQENASGESTRSMGRERMRRGGLQQEQQEGSTLGDSFSFSRTEEERSYAKDEAQKQFDERVDQERRGEDFGARSSRRW